MESGCEQMMTGIASQQIQCSLCSEEWCFETDDDVSLLNYKYCPNCGAKMDGGNDNVSD